jgi:hypothetical protein
MTPDITLDARSNRNVWEEIHNRLTLKKIKRYFAGGLVFGLYLTFMKS